MNQPIVLRKLSVRGPPSFAPPPLPAVKQPSPSSSSEDDASEPSYESASKNSEESISVEGEYSGDENSGQEPIEVDFDVNMKIPEDGTLLGPSGKPMTARQRAILGGAKTDKSIPLFQAEPKAQKKKGAAPCPKVEIQAKKRKLKVQQKLEDEKELVIHQLLSAKYKPKNDNDDEPDQDPETAPAPPPLAKNDFRARILQDQKTRLRTKVRTGDFITSGPNETTITFINESDIPPILKAPQKFTQYPPPRPTCQADGCKNPKLYNHKKTGLPVCSLACYQKLEA